MSKFRKLFSAALPVYIARYTQKKIARFLDKNDEKEKLRKDRQWKEFFKDKSSIVHQLTDKVKINLYKEDVLARWIFDGFETEEVRFIQDVLKEGDVFIDVGCNIGLFSLIASEIVGDKGSVECFEPSIRTFERLQENIKLNGFTNIKSHNIGISNEKGVLRLNVSEDGHDAWNTFAANTDEKFHKIEEVAVSTLDIRLDGLDKNRIALVKVDVEGWEKYVFQGASNFLKEYSPTLMVEFSEANTFAAGYFVQEVYDILAGLDYQWFRYMNGKLVAEVKKLHYPYDNLIATKDITALRLRLKSEL
jgi:FkbM family methyltransferase